MASNFHLLDDEVSMKSTLKDSISEAVSYALVTGASTKKRQSPTTPRTPGPKLDNDLVADLVR